MVAADSLPPAAAQIAGKQPHRRLAELKQRREKEMTKMKLKERKGSKNLNKTQGSPPGAVHRPSSPEKREKTPESRIKNEATTCKGVADRPSSSKN